MKKYFLATLFILAVIATRAQQLPLYSQYMINDFLVNPAVAGLRPYYEMKTNIRYQWVGVDDAPRTYILSVNGPWKGKNMGVGGYIFNDVTGPTRRSGFSASYSYHLKLSETIKVNLGLSGGLQQFTIDGGKILIDNNDPVLSNGIQQVLIPDFGFGAHVYAEKWWVGLSTPQINNTKLRFFDNVDVKGRALTHIYMMGGYKHTIGEDYLIEPFLMMKYVYPVTPQFDLSVRATYKKMVWAGLSYRTQGSMSLLLGYIYDDHITIAYSYDYPLNSIRKYSTGSHEVMLAVKFNKGMVSTK